MEDRRFCWLSLFLILTLLGEESPSLAKVHFPYRKDQYDMLVLCNEKEDVSEWNQWRESNSTEVIKLQEADLSRMKLNSINLSKADLEGAILKDSWLEKANLKGTNLQNAHLDGARFTSANFSESTLKGVSAVATSFGGVDFTDAILENARLQEASFGGASICRANLKGAHLEGADLIGAEILETELINAILRDTNLKRAKIVGTNLTGANLVHVNMLNSKLTNTNLTATNLQNSELSSANFVDCELRDADLTGCLLRACIFKRTNIEGADFRMSMVDGFTRFLDCMFDERTDFRGVGLGNIRIRESDRIFLERNIRKMNWDEWYNDHKLQKWIVQPFWWISDYGYSTWRIIIVFAISTILFAFIYGIAGEVFLQGIFNSGKKFKPAWRYWLVRIFRPLYFSVVTMTTLGLGDIRSNPKSVFGHTFIIFQVVWGYILLGAIITRLGILFTSGGPGL